MTKEEMREGIKANMSEVIMAVEVIGEILEENENLVAHVLLPVAKQLTTIYGEAVVGMMCPIYKERVLCIIESIDTLEEAGFTREDAIKLLSK